MYKTEKRQVTTNEHVKTHVICDVCGKEEIGSCLPDNWHEISAHHNNWGNDSCESFEEWMVCSPDCYKVKLKEVVSEFSEYNTAEIDKMQIEFAKSMVAFLYAT